MAFLLRLVRRGSTPKPEKFAAEQSPSLGRAEPPPPSSELDLGSTSARDRLPSSEAVAGGIEGELAGQHGASPPSAMLHEDGRGESGRRDEMKSVAEVARGEGEEEGEPMYDALDQEKWSPIPQRTRDGYGTCSPWATRSHAIREVEGSEGTSRGEGDALGNDLSSQGDRRISTATAQGAGAGADVDADGEKSEPPIPEAELVALRFAVGEAWRALLEEKAAGAEALKRAEEGLRRIRGGRGRPQQLFPSGPLPPFPPPLGSTTTHLPASAAPWPAPHLPGDKPGQLQAQRQGQGQNSGAPTGSGGQQAPAAPSWRKGGLVPRSRTADTAAPHLQHLQLQQLQPQHLQHRPDASRAPALVPPQPYAARGGGRGGLTFGSPALWHAPGGASAMSVVAGQNTDRLGEATAVGSCAMGSCFLGFPALRIPQRNGRGRKAGAKPQRWVVDSSWMDALRKDFLELNARVVQLEEQNRGLSQAQAVRDTLIDELLEALDQQQQRSTDVEHMLARIAQLHLDASPSSPPYPGMAVVPEETLETEEGKC